MEYSDAERNFAEVIAMRIIATADVLLAQLNRDHATLIYGKPVANLMELVVKASLALKNLHFVGEGHPGAIYQEVALRHTSLIAVLKRVTNSLCSLSEWD